METEMKQIASYSEHGQFSVILSQQSKDKFAVIYGKLQMKDLTYDEAAQELGACLMHQAGCAGKMKT
jgi:muramidase (phage lysozyme)